MLKGLCANVQLNPERRKSGSAAREPSHRGAWLVARRERVGEAPETARRICHNTRDSEPERLVFTWAWEKPEGHPGHETLVTVNFAEHGAKTKMTFRQAVFPSVRERDSHRGGWSESFERLARYVAKA